MVHATDEAEFGAPHTQEDACAGSPDQNGPDQQFDELSTTAQETLAAIETGMDALIAAQLQQEEEEKHVEGLVHQRPQTKPHFKEHGRTTK